MFATDIDDTILGNAVAAERFRLTWQSLDAERRPLLVDHTGRNVGDPQWLVLECWLSPPDFLIGGIGTESDPFPGFASTSHPNTTPDP